MELVIMILLIVNIALTLMNNKAINLRPIKAYDDLHIEKQTDFIVSEIRKLSR